MLKEKEVISDPVRQMAVARKLHEEGGHAGINKTTSVIAEKYHWSRIKETVSDVIKTCEECKDLGKSPSVPSSQSQSQSQNHNQNQNQNQSENQPATQSQTLGRVPRPFSDVNGARNIPDSAADLMTPPPPPIHEHHGMEATSRILELHHSLTASDLVRNTGPYAHPSDIASLLNPPFQTPSSPSLHAPAHHLILHGEPHHASAAATLASMHDAGIYQPIDPQIISQPMHSSHAGHHHHHHHHHHQQQQQHHPPDAFSSFHPRIPVSHHHQHPASPHLRHSPLSAHDLDYAPHVSHHGHGHSHDDAESFQALLNDADADAISTPHHHHHHHHHHGSIHRDHMPTANLRAATPDHEHDHDQDAVDRDMAMLIEHDDDSPSPPPPPSPRAPSPSDMDIDDLGLGPVPVPVPVPVLVPNASASSLSRALTTQGASANMASGNCRATRRQPRPWISAAVRAIS